MTKGRTIVVGVIALLAVGWVLYVRGLPTRPPAFVIEDVIVIEATAAEVWAVLTDFDAHREWNPYLLALTGDVEAGGRIEITIVQDNWEAPLVLEQTVVAVEEARRFHWRGSAPLPGLVETDHSFHIEEAGAGRVRFVHREEFRGAIAGWLETDARIHTARAFEAMDRALAARVAGRASPD